MKIKILASASRDLLDGYRFYDSGLMKGMACLPDTAVENGLPVPGDHRRCRRRDVPRHKWFVDCASMNALRDTTFDSGSQGILATCLFARGIRAAVRDGRRFAR